MRGYRISSSQAGGDSLSFRELANRAGISASNTISMRNVAERLGLEIDDALSPIALGRALTREFDIADGQAQFFEKGLRVRRAGNRTAVAYNFPMLGRPSIAQGDATSTPFDSEILIFAPGNQLLEPLLALIKAALAGRLSLTPTGGAGAPVDRIVLEIGNKVRAGASRYGLEVASTGVWRERQLYDVAVLAEGRWVVVAPNAVYRRTDWHDFGIAHITDMHVARRIDSFRKLLNEAGESAAARRLRNWNDRFRGFIRYANYLHRENLLDVIIATGDLYDYLYEEDDDPKDGGNAAFLRRLILGQAPGPDFPDVERLLVPIFLVAGNHDYRKHPYKLLFDLHVWGVDLDRRINNGAGYNLIRAQVQVLQNLISGRPADADRENVSGSDAARMVEIDDTIAPYRAFLAESGSYPIRLGAHRIVMIDSGHDIGVIDDPLDALRVFFNRTSEDEATFVGGSPNCEGVSPDEFGLVQGTMADAGDDGLFIVGLHAPLFNLPGNAYPYFLRETQRVAQPLQVAAYLFREGPPAFDYLNSKPGRPAETRKFVEPEFIQDRNDTWFPRTDGNEGMPPGFVKRSNSQDLMDFGVSRGHAEDLMVLLAGGKEGRAADLILAGHTHRQNEFCVKNSGAGELYYYMDFFTENPARYYPSRYCTKASEGVVTLESAVTEVDVVAGANPAATPLPVADPDGGFQLAVPPYEDPLSLTRDPKKWWKEHRPLVLQTGALGPLDNPQISFTGFRLVRVKGDIIDKIHFISTARLEANQYRLSFEEAIRVDAPRRFGYRISRPSEGASLALRELGKKAGLAPSATVSMRKVVAKLGLKTTRVS